MREPTTEERVSRAGRPDEDDKMVLGFLYPQLGPCYLGDKENYNQAAFLTTVDEIEELTGLDLLTGLDDPEEKRVESRIPSQIWDTDPGDFVRAC